VVVEIKEAWEIWDSILLLTKELSHSNLLIVLLDLDKLQVCSHHNNNRTHLQDYFHHLKQV